MIYLLIVKSGDEKWLDNFITKYIDIVEIRITHFETIFIQNLAKYLAVSRNKYKLKELSKSFVFIPADKAANNIVAVWRK